MIKEYARVYLLDAPFCIDRAYDYYIPSEMKDSVKAGSFVSVPFGNSNRPKLAVVFELLEKTELAEAKPITATVSSDISLEEKMLGLASFMKEQTLCTMGDAIHAMVPSAALSRLIEFYRPAKEQPEAKKSSLSQRDLFVLDYINERGSLSIDSLKNRFGAKSAESVAALISAKLIEKELVLKDSDEDRRETVYAISPIYISSAQMLANGEKVGAIKLASTHQRGVLSALLVGAARSQRRSPSA